MKKKYKGTLFLLNGIKTASMFMKFIEAVIHSLIHQIQIIGNMKRQKTVALGEKTSLIVNVILIMVVY